MLADDLVQETIAAGITNVKQLRDEARLFPWLYGILRNNWNRHLRGRKVHQELDDQIASEEFGPFCACEELEIVRRVRCAVAELPPEQRQVLSLVDLEELSYCEVADVLGIPIGTVMSRLHRARRNLLERMEAPAPSGIAQGRIHVVR